MSELHYYDDILHLPHPVSKRHPQMPVSDRAAQFAPFAALTGHADAVKEAERLTESRAELGCDAIEILNAKMQLVLALIKQRPEIAVTYFKPDEKKAGGAYLTIYQAVKKIDDIERILVMEDGTKIPISMIVDIDGRIFTDGE